MDRPCELLLRPADLAARIGLSRSRIYQLIAAGELPAVRIGGALRIPAKAWEGWLQKKSEDALAAMRDSHVP